MKLRKTILSMLICCSMLLTSFGTVLAADTPQEPQTDESGTYLIGTADELFAFAELAKSIAEADTDNSRKISARLTADINLNPGVTFAYDHETGLVTVAKGEESCKMGSGMKGTELGNFHPVYNDLCSQAFWDAETTTVAERNSLIAQMNEKVEALGLKKWTPIGGGGFPYIGTFDGGGHTIDGLYINDSSIKYTGLFGVFGNGTAGGYSYTRGELKNLTIGENSLVVGHTKAGYLNEDGSTGAFVGKLDYDTVSDCTNYATVVGEGKGVSYNMVSADHGYYKYGHVSGFAGLVIGKLQSCVNYGTIVSKASAGGIAGNIMGYDNNHGSVISCTNYGSVYADTESGGYAGGIAVNAGGDNRTDHYAGPIEACTNYGYVEGSGASGIVRSASRNTNIRYCANRGRVYASSSASGIVDYMGFDGSTVEACFNAGKVAFLPNVSTADKTPYPITSGIHLYQSGTEYKPESHQIRDCYNDKTVCPAEDDALCGATVTNIKNCYSVTTEVFATGEPAYNMKASFRDNLWRQNLAAPPEEGKTPEIYPTTDGTRRVYENPHYCCHTDDTNKQADKTVFYSNVSDEITDDHTPDASGICTHCKMDVRKPIFLLDTLPEAKVGQSYSVTIRLDNDVLMVNGNIKESVSETDETKYVFTHGLNGEALYSYSYYKYYYYISGIPTEPGELTFTLSATNGNGTTKKTYTIKINEADPLEILTKTRLDNGTVGESYSCNLSTNSDFETTWSLEEGSSLPDQLTLSNDGTISGTPKTDGTYTFTVVASVGGQTAKKAFTLVILEEGGCKHGKTTLIQGTPATCLHDGVADYYHCNICEKDIDEDRNEIWNMNNLRTASNHADNNNDGTCDSCGKNMPIFKKVANEGGIVYGGTYIFVTTIGEKYYALAIPPEGKGGREYTELMNLCEITPKTDGTFDFSELKNKDAIMLKTEFAASGGDLDAGTPRYGLSSVFDNTRYTLDDSGPRFWMYPNESAKYGFRITLDPTTGAARIGSVYHEWWSTPETAEYGLLRAFDMTYNGENTRFMSLYPASDYNGEKAAYSNATMNECPIYLYRMTDVGTTAGGRSFISNDSNGSVNRDAVMEILDLTAEADLSNASGIANAVTQTAVATCIDAVETPQTSMTAEISAVITAKTAEAETDEKEGKTPISITYSVTPKISILGADGSVLATHDIADNDLNGAPITVTLYAGFEPEQIIHYKKDGTKEYFYGGRLDKAKNGAKSFEFENGFVTFTITDFSDFKILKTAEAEEDAKNKLSYDGKTLTATVEKGGNYTVIFAGYGKDSKLSYCKTAVCEVIAGTSPIAIPNDVEMSRVNKIMLWKDLTSLKPICKAWEMNE